MRGGGSQASDCVVSVCVPYIVLWVAAAERVKKGGEPKRKEGEVETNLAAGAMGHRRGGRRKGR